MASSSEAFANELPRETVAPFLTRCDIRVMPKKPYGQPVPGVVNRIREHRMRLRWSMQELADKAGSTLQTVQRWETSGKGLTVEKMALLAEKLGVTPADLVVGGTQLTEEESFILDRYRNASSSERRYILRSVKGVTDRDEEAFEVRPGPSPRKGAAR